jgi:hypothetical protein
MLLPPPPKAEHAKRQTQMQTDLQGFLPRSKQRNVERRKDRNRFVQVGLVRNRKF